MTTTNQRAVEVLEQALKVAQRDMEHYFQRATKAEARVAEQSAAGFSWDGHMVHGDRASIEAVKQSLTTRTPGWRPISEAPRDGAAVLLWNKSWPTPAVGWVGKDDWRVGYDIRSNSHKFSTSATAPTLWQPLPPPPGEG